MVCSAFTNLIQCRKNKVYKLTTHNRKLCFVKIILARVGYAIVLNNFICLQGVYAVAVFFLSIFILALIFSHTIYIFKSWLFSDDAALKESKKEFDPSKRRNAIAECGESINPCALQ